MYPYDILHRYSEHIVWIVFPEIFFCCKRYLFNILERFDVLGFKAYFIEFLFIMRYVVVTILHRMLEPLQLQFLDFFSICAFKFPIPYNMFQRTIPPIEKRYFPA